MPLQNRVNPNGELMAKGRYTEFKEKWLEANQSLLLDNSTSIANIDKIVHMVR